MTTASEELLFNQAYSARVRELRLERGWTADQMATALGVPADRYRKYEVRSPMPLYLVERFALIVGRDIAYVITGRNDRHFPAEDRARRRA